MGRNAPVNAPLLLEKRSDERVSRVPPEGPEELPEGLDHGSEIPVVHPVRPEVSVVPLVIGLRPDHEVRGVHAEAIVAPMPNHLVRPDNRPQEDAINEAIRGQLMTPETGLAGAETDQLAKHA